ncbi:homeobox protein ceh-5-like [Adelges cooleyi]|uniref:homeobox protein ceh-5-like n=1 Tax=Adelges cooleyi TaxID=133065 RepID=UPI00217F8514|nr:homeobox protein ceh-5-like [Adelges cooleyi]XP_050440059.1 homeobox protein ceh-5-like [Adelges cooleyi]
MSAVQQSASHANDGSKVQRGGDDNQRRRPVFQFSVDYILNKAGNAAETDAAEQQHHSHRYDWLLCTRFKPPKLDRTKKKDGQQKQKRRPGRNPRIPFTTDQVATLEREFRQNAYLGGANDVQRLSERLRLSESRIKIWFQNRRARERRDHHNGHTTTPATTNDNAHCQFLQTSTTSAFRPLSRLT